MARSLFCAVAGRRYFFALESARPVFLFLRTVFFYYLCFINIFNYFCHNSIVLLAKIKTK